MIVAFKQLSIYRQALMGIAILYVFLFHTVTDWAPEWVYKVTSNGDNGVDIFIFLSALGLSYSMSKNGNVMEFYKRRLLRIFPTYWASITIIFLVVVIIIKYLKAPDGYLPYPHNLWEAFTAYTTIGYWIHGSLWYDWYIPAIVLLYLLFPLLFKVLQKSKVGGVLLFIASTIITSCDLIHLEWYYACLWHRICIFILGAASFYIIDKEINGWTAILIMLVGTICPFIYAYSDILNTGVGVVDKLIFCLVLFCTMLCLCQICRVKQINAILSFMGSISLEFYLVHQQIYRMIQTVGNKVCQMPDFIQIIFCFVTSLILAVALQKGVNYLTSIRLQKPCNQKFQ